MHQAKHGFSKKKTEGEKIEEKNLDFEATKQVLLPPLKHLLLKPYIFSDG